MLNSKVKKIVTRILAATSFAAFFISSALADVTPVPPSTGSGSSTGSGTTYNPLDLLWGLVDLFLAIAIPVGTIMVIIAVILIAKGYKQKAQHDMDVGIDWGVAAAMVLGIKWILGFLGIVV